jgi:hypothetical protein
VTVDTARAPPAGANEDDGGFEDTDAVDGTFGDGAPEGSGAVDGAIGAGAPEDTSAVDGAVGSGVPDDADAVTDEAVPGSSEAAPGCTRFRSSAGTKPRLTKTTLPSAPCKGVSTQ